MQQVNRMFVTVLICNDGKMQTRKPKGRTFPSELFFSQSKDNACLDKRPIWHARKTKSFQNIYSCDQFYT